MEENEIKSEKNKIFIVAMGIIALLIVIAIIAIFAGNSKPEIEDLYYTKGDGTQVNISNELKNVKTLEGLTIKIISLTEHENYTRILGKVVNATDETLGGYDIQCILMDREGNEKARVDGFIPVIKAGETGDLNCSIIGAYADIYDIKIVKK